MADYTKGKRKAKRKGSSAKPKVIRARRAGQFDGDDDAPEAMRPFWRCESSEEAAETAWAWTERVRVYHSTDAMMDLIHEAIYRGRPVGQNATAVGRNYILLRNGQLLNLNLVMSLVDTATARLTKRRPMPMISADDATYSQHMFAKECSRILRRKVGGTKITKASPLVLRDMCIRGDGMMKAYPLGGDVTHKRIPIHEVLVDPFEAEQDDIRTLAHVRPESRDVMRAMYPKYKAQIDEAPAYSRAEPWQTYVYQQQTTSDFIEVRELWHLPSFAGAGDGEHIVTIKGAAVCRRKWRWPKFPIVKFGWSPPTRGWRSEGLVGQLAGIQEQINDILRDVREALKYGSQLTIFVQRGANVDKHHLRKRHPAVVEHDGPEPHYVAPNPVSEQAIRILLMLIDQARVMSGMSEWSTSGQNPLGANASGKALATIDDQQSDRFAHVESGWQQGRVDLGEVTAYLARDLYEESHGKVDADYEEAPDAPEPKELAAWIRDQDWSKLELESGDYHMVLEPVNYLADSREGRLAQVAELGQNGLIPDPSIQADLFDEPDLQRANRVILGPKHKIDMLLEGLANTKIALEELAPDQYTNLPLAILMAKGEMNEAESKRKHNRTDDMLEEVLERFRWFIERCKDEQKRSNGADVAPSLPGMMSNAMGAAPNAATLQPGLMGDPMAGGPPMDPAMMGAPPVLQ